MCENNAQELAQEFIANLRAMATGSYLREEDKEFWETPYPESAVDRAEQLIDNLLRSAAESLTTPSTSAAQEDEGAVKLRVPGTDDAGEGTEPAAEPTAQTLALVGAIEPWVLQLKELSDKFFGAVLDVEEIDELSAIARAVALDAEAQPELVEGHVRALIEE